MSSNLYWEPTNRKKMKLDIELRRVLRNLYGQPLDITLDVENLGELSGLKAAGIEDAEKLIEAIEKYDEITLSESF